ncbi:hypothetical protein EG329_003760 [Mollisiaceae sp. DMI_Dod_QoI]|nr:hypothetical protein EG329_003760 [Helotiales sp. DMI_Dod_QoI]
MCLCIPNFPFRNTIIIDRDNDDTEASVRAFFNAPQEPRKTRRLFVYGAFFPHHNTIHYRKAHTKISYQDLPSSQHESGLMERHPTLGSIVKNILHNRPKECGKIQSLDEIADEIEQYHDAEASKEPALLDKTAEW